MQAPLLAKLQCTLKLRPDIFVERSFNIFISVYYCRYLSGAHAGRQEILQTHIQKQGLPLGADVTVASIAASTTGFTGADLANLINEAALLAGRSDKGNLRRHTFAFWFAQTAF